MLKIFGFFFSTILFLLTTKSVLAVTVTVSDYSDTITQDPFMVTVSVEGAQTGTNYLKVDLYKEGTTSYFGETYNGTDWYSGSDGKQYFPINVQSGQVWAGPVQARVGSPPFSKYDGPGSYKMRIRRYTSSGNSASAQEANESSVTIYINISAPSQSPSASPTSTSSSSNKSSSTKSTSSASTKASPTQSQMTAKSSPSISRTLGEKNISIPKLLPSSTPSASPESQDEAPPPTKVAGFLTGFGALLVGASLFFYFWYYKVKNKPKKQIEKPQSQNNHQRDPN